MLQHVTWSVNSLCHVFGSRPFATRRHDRATNLWPLALVSFGESWHNMHHSDPACARHGAEPGQIDISAAVIRVFERLGWATGVHWPVPARLTARRRNPGRGLSHSYNPSLSVRRTPDGAGSDPRPPRHFAAAARQQRPAGMTATAAPPSSYTVPFPGRLAAPEDRPWQ